MPRKSYPGKGKVRGPKARTNWGLVQTNNEPVPTRSFRLRRDQLLYLLQLGEGNMSKGFRDCIDYHMRENTGKEYWDEEFDFGELGEPDKEGNWKNIPPIDECKEGEK